MRGVPESKHRWRAWLRMAWLLSVWWAVAAAVPQAPAAEAFTFVVIGDTRPRFESENFRVFEGLIPKINALQPAFVINLGDLIYGYGPRNKEKQWDRYQQAVRSLRAPYYQLPGNHDTYSKEARRIYARRFGAFYGSFDHGDCHFVLLDNNDGGRWGHIGAAQMDWLQRDLAQNRARTVFVFAHFPVWEPERLAPACYESWARTLHPLFRVSRVRAVFGGHFHAYGPTREFDGIQYYISGGGGAELRPDYQRSGGEHHFLKVSVAGDRFDLRVATEHGDLTDAEADVMGGLIFADRHSSRLGIDPGRQDLRQGVDFTLEITNSYPDVLAGTAQWHLDASTFVVSPLSVSVRVPSGGAQQLAFNLRSRRDVLPLQTLPWLEFNLAGGGRHHRFQRELLLLEPLRAPYRAPDRAASRMAGRSAARVLERSADPWRQSPALPLGDGSRPAAEVRAAYDQANLFLAVRLPVTPEGVTEPPGFYDELQVGVAARLGAAGIGRDTLRIGVTRTGDGLAAINRMPGRGFGEPVKGVRGACRVAAGFIGYELAIPRAALGSLRLDAGSRLVLNLAFPLVEGEGEPAEPAAPKPNSFSYQVRYGSDALVPIHFIELTLEPRRARTSP